eukprot:jgi/Mesvir1/2919/Mv13989-RA.1
MRSSPFRISTYFLFAFNSQGVKYETKPYNTKPIVDEKGHLLPGVPKKQKSAFISNPGPGSPRWPSPDPTKPKPSSATMGYKGIQTETYLPMSTVPLPTTCMRTNTR